MNPYARHADDTAELKPTGVTTAELQPDGRSAPDPRSAPDSWSVPDSRTALHGSAEAVEPAHDVDLSQDPFADDLSEQLEAVAPRRWTGRTTVALAALVLLVGGFLGGTQVEKHWGTPGSGSSSSRPNPFASGNPFAGGAGGLAGRFGGAGGAGAAGGGRGTAAGGTGSSGAANSGAASGGAASGTVKLVDGDTVYITTSDGQTVIVKTTGSTSVDLTQPGSLKDLAPGTSVTIQGQAGTDGSVNATSITKTK